MVKRYMNMAIKLAKEAAETGNVPVGAVIVYKGKVITQSKNGKYPCEHAELEAIKKASQILDSKNLSDCDLYVTLEPCPMCAGAILLSGIKNIWFGAYDKNYGAAISKDNSFARYSNISKVNINGGIMEDECKKLIKDYFIEKRGTQNENAKKETQR